MKFNYQVLTKGGRTTSGFLPAASLAAAQEELEKKGLFVLSLKIAFRRPFQRGKKKPSNVSLAYFFRDLGMHRQSGIPILQALEDLSHTTTNKLMLKTIKEAQKKITAGISLSQALRETDIFPEISITTLKSGESAGKIGEALLELGKYHQNQGKLREIMISAVTYPALVTFFLGGVLAIIIFYLIPTLAPLIENLSLPLVAKIVIRATEIVRHFWYLLLLAAIGFGFGMHFFSQTPRAQTFLNSFHQKNRIGRMLSESSIANLYYGLAILHRSGVNLTQALSSVALTTSQYFSAHLLKVRNLLLERGYSFSQALSAQKGVFPILVCQTIANGENTNRLTDALSRVAEIYTEKTTRNMEVFSRLLGPMLLVMVGALIVVIGATILLPIYGNISSMALIQ